jgi:hypothetical protein
MVVVADIDDPGDGVTKRRLDAVPRRFLSGGALADHWRQGKFASSARDETAQPTSYVQSYKESEERVAARHSWRLYPRRAGVLSLAEPT